MILMIFLKGTHQWRKTDVKYGLWKSGRKCRSKYSLYQNILQEKPRKESQHGKKHGLLRWGGQGLVVVPLEWQFCHEVPQQPRHRHLREEQHLGGAMEGLTMRMIFARRNLKSIITDLPHLDDGFDAFCTTFWSALKFSNQRVSPSIRNFFISNFCGRVWKKWLAKMEGCLTFLQQFKTCCRFGFIHFSGAYLHTHSQCFS